MPKYIEKRNATCCRLLRVQPVKCARRLSAGGVADEWATQILRQGDAPVFKNSQMKLQMKREAWEKLNRHASEVPAQKAGELAKAGAHTATVTVQ